MTAGIFVGIFWALYQHIVREIPTMPITDTLCRNIRPTEKAQKLSDGGGLYLFVPPTGGKLWRMNYRFQGKQKTLALGSYPEISLKEARALRDRAKEHLAHDIDPSKHKKKTKALSQIEAANTFEAIAREWYEAKESGWADSHSFKVRNRLEQDVYPQIGAFPIKEIDAPILLNCIRQIEKRGALVLARKVLQICGQVIRYAVATGRAQRDPSSDLRGALKAPERVKHRAALKGTELPEFFTSLENYDGDEDTIIALKLIMHTFLRTSEVRQGRWAEIENLDGKNPLWRIPAERMKAHTEHLVPLTKQSVALLKALKKFSGGSEFMLPAATKEGVISQNTLIYALYRMGYHSRATVHGFRGTASTVLNENGFNRDWIERQLAHAERNDVRAAYNSAEWLPQRREMMEWWSNYLDQAEKGGNVIPFKGEVA